MMVYIFPTQVRATSYEFYFDRNSFFQMEVVWVKELSEMESFRKRILKTFSMGYIHLSVS